MFKLFFQNKSSKTSQASPELSKVKAYRRIVIRSVYLQQHPNNTSESEVKCKDCGSEDIKEWGLLKRDDHKRVHSCSDCGQILFRTIDRLPQIKVEQVADENSEQKAPYSLVSC
ncbi:hypothetical protein DS2_05570 [Catenovulum agarivorans DS-2]|uniref:Uncharacterized protein n=1 Tax=Catenovulum agarivorans DS-2 TaxID=1328313 RepID=W7QPU9_9ALTE|nr:hypothetical protein [Catenovulum agarivorans]EWH11012.1 hypothetical protein DS2_05570 [Catenovulum agarivorans DS-2]